MRKLSSLQEKIYNSDERLIPGVTHDIPELVRHRNDHIFCTSSYESAVADCSSS